LAIAFLFSLKYLFKMDFIPFDRDIAESIIVDDETSDEEMDHDDPTFAYGNLVLLADIDTVPQLQVKFKKVEEDHMQEDTEMMENAFEQKKKRSYEKYGEEQVLSFIILMQEEGLSIPKAANRCGIPRSTAYELMDLWKLGTGTVLPTKPKSTRGRPPK
jgi:hypothetical protein